MFPTSGVLAFPNGDTFDGYWVTRISNGEKIFFFYVKGKLVAEWKGSTITDKRKKDANDIDTTEAVVKNDDSSSDKDGSTPKSKTNQNDSTPKDEEDAFTAFEKKYRENFNLIMRELEAEKQFLIEKGVKIRDEMENIARQLESDEFSTEEKESLSQYLKSLESALVENELAFQDARQKTTDVINKMRNTILEQDTHIEVIEAEKAREQEQLRFFAFIATLAIAICFVLFMIYRKIDNQKGEIEAQSRLLEKKNNDITASINYARRIQIAALPPNADIYRALPESFIFFEPRDIVSGDFYWFKEIDNKLFLAALDCTGHGVPGAFMSMIGNKLLNEIVETKRIHDVDHILQELHKGVFASLKQDETTNRDGMDISICMINKFDNKLEFAGARHPLLIVQNGEIEEIKGDRYSIGGLKKKEGPKIFTKKVVELDNNAPHKQTFYIFSDGFRDQFGENQDKKYGKRRFKDFLLSIQDEPMKKQRISLRNELLNWKGDQKQLDDILVIGFQAT